MSLGDWFVSPTITISQHWALSWLALGAVLSFKNVIWVLCYAQCWSALTIRDHGYWLHCRLLHSFITFHEWNIQTSPSLTIYLCFGQPGQVSSVHVMPMCPFPTFHPSWAIGKLEMREWGPILCTGNTSKIVLARKELWYLYLFHKD